MMPPSCFTFSDEKYRVFSLPPLTLAEVSSSHAGRPYSSWSKSWQTPALKSACPCAPKTPAASAALLKQRVSYLLLILEPPTRCVTLNWGALNRPRLVVIRITPLEALEP